MNVSKLIVETFEKEQPALCKSIKMAVDAGESKEKFLRFIKSVFGAGCESTVTYQLCITVFDYYKKATV
jgi:hypothetical protein